MGDRRRSHKSQAQMGDSEEEHTGCWGAGGKGAKEKAGGSGTLPLMLCLLSAKGVREGGNLKTGLGEQEM